MQLDLQRIYTFYFTKMSFGSPNIKLDVRKSIYDPVTERLTPIKIGKIRYWIKFSSFRNQIWCLLHQSSFLSNRLSRSIATLCAIHFIISPRFGELELLLLVLGSPGSGPNRSRSGSTVWGDGMKASWEEWDGSSQAV